MVNLPADARDMGSIPGSGTFPAEGNGNPLQYSCLENPLDRGAWWVQSMGSQRVGADWLHMHSVCTPTPQQPLIYFLLQIFLFWTFCVLGTTQGCPSGLASLAQSFTLFSTLFSIIMNAVAVLSFLLPNYIPLYRYNQFLSYLSVDI